METGSHHVAPRKARGQHITSKSEPYDDTMINKNELMYKIEVASEMPKPLAKEL